MSTATATAAKREITRNDILPLPEYEKIRSERRGELVAAKKNRRVSVGPDATFYFENFDTMWWQIHEMLRIEKGGEAQIADELSAYNPLIPQGRDLVATMMFEIEDPARRNTVLAGLTGVEDTVELRIGDDVVRARAEQDVERTKDDGKTSSVHFLHFDLTDDQADRFRDPSVTVTLGINHANYGHMAMLGPDTRAALAEDLD
jgi:hypothetical protein